MQALSAADSERLLGFIAEADRTEGDRAITPELLVELGSLIDADWVSYCELDRVRQRELDYVCRPGEETAEGDVALYWDFVSGAHPVCISEERGMFNAQKLSDYTSLRELRSSRLYAEWFGPYGVERELSVAIPSPLWHTKVLMFDRGPGKDFSERDRTVLDRLQPHLARWWHAARTRRLLNAALAELDRADEHDREGVIFLGPAAEVEFASPSAQRLLREFFTGGDHGQLPAPLASWLETGADHGLTRRLGSRVLVIERTGDSLLLRERMEDAQLTAREREVLAWVARGKTNGEIAQLLWLAPSTVRKHLENVYAKLGVTTRTAAAARFLGQTDAEAS